VRSSFGRDIPGEKFLDAIDGMIGDARQDVAQVTFRVESVKFCSSDQAVHRSRTLSAIIRAGEKKVLSSKRDNPLRKPFP
jgi:hypothetical protein